MRRAADGLTVLGLVDRGSDGFRTSQPAQKKAADQAASEDADQVTDQGTVSDTLETIALIVEEQNKGFKCSVLLLDKPGLIVAGGGGPSLPKAYNAAVEGLAIGPYVGSCGTASYWNVPVIVDDIQNDFLWRDLAALAKESGVASCWSHPFSSRSGRVLGALALYSPEPMAPTAEQLSRLRAAARLTGLAVERARAEEALRASEVEARKQRAREAELEEQLRRAAKLEALGVLAGGVAHDFNNLLATMQGNAELAMKYLPEESEPIEMLLQIVKACNRASGLTKQMLAYAGRGKRTSAKVEINRLLTDMGGLLEVALSKKAKLEYALSPDLLYAFADQSQLEQVAMNLVTNAAEALGDKEGTIRISTESCTYDASALAKLGGEQDLEPGEYVRVKVSDTGEGMGPETQERIFDPFFTTKFTGRGLGLAAVTGIVNGHSGVISLESELGVGTTFTVLLPRKEAPDVKTADSNAATPSGARKKILVVDDEADLRQLFGRTLRLEGFDALMASNGQEALDLIRESPSAIDCVLLDVSMPQLDGEETYRELRALREDLPVIVISGHPEDEVLERFKGSSLLGVLPKPVKLDHLIATIRSAPTMKLQPGASHAASP
ncbi:MAG: response regulator [Gemmatimonadales bacterium]|nr:response regulator [Gemmatimonadales bacterium]